MTFRGTMGIHLIILSTFLLTACAQAKMEIHNLKDGKTITEEELVQLIPDQGSIILGEYHYSEPIQKAEGDLITKITTAKKSEGHFTVGWEFLDYPEQERLSDQMDELKLGKINETEFLLNVFKSKEAAERHEVYLPFFRSIRDLDGQLVATNAPRDWKRIITSKGLAALDPKLIPQNCQIGSNNYLERFKEIMSDHVPAEALPRFFEAQYYTDCVIAESMKKMSKHDLRFLIIGSFHSDYNDAAVREIKRVSGEEVISIKIVDGEKLSKEELNQMIAPHEKYGRIADFLYVIK